MNHRKENARDKLLEAGKQLFLEKGYHDLTIKSVTDACDMAVGTFYNYFTSKEDLIVTLVKTQNDSLYHTILDASPAMTFWKDTDRRFLGANRAFLDFYGFTAENELIGKNDEDMGWHSDPDPFKNDEQCLLDTGTSIVRVHGKCMVHGTEHDIVASKNPVYDNGKITGFVGCFEDVTEQYRARDELGHLTNVLSSLPVGICIFKRHFSDCICLNANSFFADMLGRPSVFFAGKTLDSLLKLVHEDDRERCVRDEAQLFAAERSMSGTYRFKKDDTDSFLWLNVEGRFIRHQDDEEFIYFVFTDVDALKKSEAAEQSLRRVYEASIETAQLFVWTYDIKKRRVTMNDNAFTRRRCAELHLPSVIDHMPGAMLEIIEPEYREQVQRVYNDIDSGKPFAECDVKFIQIKGQQPLYLHLSYTNTFDRFGKPDKAYGITQNVTKEMLSKEQYEHELSFIHGSHEGYFIARGHHDLTANRFIEYIAGKNAALQFPPGTKYDDAFKKLLKTMPYESDRKKYIDMYSRMNLISRYEAGETSFSLDYRRSDGTNPNSWVTMDIRTFKSPFSGNIECFIYSYDVTEKYLKQQIAADMAELGYRNIGLIDVQTKSAVYYRLCSDTSEFSRTRNITDYEQNAEHVIRSFVRKEDQDAVISAVSLSTVLKKLNESGSYSYTFSRTNSDGSILRQFMKYRYLDEMKLVVTVYIMDVTEQYEEDQLQIELLKDANMRADKANEAKSAFLSSMSHDMRTPLNGIIGFTRLALATGSDQKRKEYLEKIDLSSKLMLDLVNDVLDLSKIESGKMVLSPQIFSGKEIVDSMIETVRQSAAARGVNLEVTVPDVQVPYLRADRLRLAQIQLNLLSNAVKYTLPGGSVRFIVERMNPSVSNGYNYRITVSDTGIGIGKEFLPHLFEPFSQEHAKEAEGVQGTGLGLSIVKSIVDLMKGKIDVQSEKGKGTTFIVLLYIEEVSGGNELPAMAVHPTDFIGRHVLLCEDNYLNAEIAQELLKENGMTVVLAADGKAGVAAFVSSAPGYFDVVLMDIRMPVMDGFEATRAIRALTRKDAQVVPVIAMTADAFEENFMRAKEAGMNAYVVKPFVPERLLAAIAEQLQKNNRETI